MYTIVTPAVCVAAIATLAPEGWSFEDVEKKTFNVIKNAFEAVEFAQKKRKDGAKLIRLKINRKTKLATYTAGMAGSVQNTQEHVMDLHDWLWDVQELQDSWGEDSIESVRVPREIHDFVKDMFKVAKKTKEQFFADAVKEEPVNA